MSAQAPISAALPVRIGEVLAGKYRVERILGRGGMGVVVAALHLQLQELVAIKLLLPAVGSRPDFIQRFLREARAAVKIKSMHVAHVLDVDTLSDGRLYMVMEYLEGKDLGQVIDQHGPLPQDEAIDYVLQVCEALAEAHALGIVHRDLKPSNLFLTHTQSGVPLIKVLDFGISKMSNEFLGAAAQDARLTGETALIGSPLYMSPEQIRSAKDVDGRTDVWSLGVILHELLSGKTPFDGENYSALLASIAADPPIPLHVHLSSAPPELETVILRCLEKKPDLRVASVLELARLLEPFATPEAVHSVERALRSVNRTSQSPAPNFARVSTSGGTRASRLSRASSPPDVDAMADTINTLNTTTPDSSSRRMFAAAVGVAGLAAVATVLVLALRTPASSGNGERPAASVSAEGPEQPSATVVNTASAAVSAPLAPPVQTVQSAEAQSKSADASPDAGTGDAGPALAPWPSGTLKPANTSAISKPSATSPSYFGPDGGIRLGKEVDSRK